MKKQKQKNFSFWKTFSFQAPPNILFYLKWKGFAEKTLNFGFQFVKNKKGNISTVLKIFHKCVCFGYKHFLGGLKKCFDKTILISSINQFITQLTHWAQYLV